MYIALGNFEHAPIGTRVTEILQDYCVVDLETTGLNSFFDETLEICALRVRNNVIVDSFCELVKPERDIPPFIIELTGITPEMVKNARPIKEVLYDFLDFVQDDVVLGHNITFDLHFLSNDSNYYFQKPFLNNYINTLPWARKVFKNFDNHKLSTLAQGLQLSSPSHRADADCIATKGLYDKIIEVAKEKNIDLSQKNTSKRLKASDVYTTRTEFDENNPFYEKVCVFTGKISIARKEAWQMVDDVGGHHKDTLTLDTNFLIVGNTDYMSNLKGEKTKKLQKAEKMIQDGYDLQILTEETFLSLIKS